MFGIQDPSSGKNLFRISDPWGKKPPDPGSATLGTGTALLRTSYQCNETIEGTPKTHDTIPFIAWK
jgi:hypothetical protein